MCRSGGDSTSYAPLYIHSFRLTAQRFWQRYEEISSVPDRLRWLRSQTGMTQAEVAAQIRVSRSLYIHMENGVCEKSSFPILDRLAALYQVPVTDLLDEYNLFLYNGQGRQIKALRNSRGMSVAQFAESLGVYASTVRKWEREQARMTKHIWERLRLK